MDLGDGGSTLGASYFCNIKTKTNKKALVVSEIMTFNINHAGSSV